MRVTPAGGGGGTPAPRPSSGGGGSSIGGGSGIPNFSGWQVSIINGVRTFVGAVLSDGTLIRPGQAIPGRPGFVLSVPPQFQNLPTSGGGGGGGNPGGTGGGPPIVPPSAGGGGAQSGLGGNVPGGSSALPASSGLLGVLEGMFPFVSQAGQAFGSAGSILSTGTAIEDVAQVFGQIGALLGQFLRGVELLFTPTFWLRVILFLMGLPVLAYGLVQLGRHHSGPGVAAGIVATGVALILMFGAFHNLPTSVVSPGTFAQWLHDSLTGQATLTAATAPVNSIMEPPLTAPGATGGSTGP